MRFLLSRFAFWRTALAVGLLAPVTGAFQPATGHEEAAPGALANTKARSMKVHP